MSALAPRHGRRRLLSFLALAAAATAVAATLLHDTPAPAQPGAPLPHRYTGVNLAGGEFKAKVPPGIYGRDYSYPDAATAAPFLAAGMTAVRVPFRWERLQPTPMAPLDIAELQHLDTSVAALAGFKLIILDPHNYASYNHAKLGTPEAPAALFSDLWSRLATHYRGNPRIAFGLMNEPNAIDGALWRELAQQGLDAVRATGARNLVLIPGANWTGAHSWTSGGSTSNASLMTSLHDSANNMAFEMHEYPDPRSTGIGEVCVSPQKISERLASATDWLRSHHVRGFLGEFGAPSTPECLAALQAMVSTLDQGRDVWLGWTYWAGGSRWHGYPFSIQPDADGPKPQLKIIKPFLAP